MPEYAAVALQTLRANPLRTILSTLGVIIGVGALVSILSLADGLEAFSRAEIEATTDLQVISVAPITTERIDGVVLHRRDYPVFTAADESDLQRALGDAAEVAVNASYASFWNIEGDTAVLQAVVAALTPATFAHRAFPIVAGRTLTHDDVASGRRVALVSAAGARLAGHAPGTLVGRAIRIGRTPYEVVGVTDSDGPDAVTRLAVPLLPPAELPGVTDAVVPVLVVRSTVVEQTREVRARTEAWLDSRYNLPERAFNVSSHADRIEQAARGMLVFKLVMGGIAGISLLVGGIGIMNVLLASVTERTREIGIRRATGASSGDIRRQFLTEAVAISAVGSALGAVLGMVTSVVGLRVISHVAEAQVSAIFAWESVLFAMVAAVVIGLVFGMYPALRASRLSPIEALRHE